MIKRKNETFYTRPAGPLGEYYAVLLTDGLLKRQSAFDIRIPSLSGRNADSCRIEVKTAEFNKKSKCGWQFNFKNRPQMIWANFFMLICLGPGLEPVAIYWVPRKELVGKKNVWIGEETAKDYEKFLFV